MAIHIQLPTEVELRLKAKAALLRQTVEEYLQDVAFREAQNCNDSTGVTQSELTPEDRAILWRAWATSHRALPTVADDSRETIYAGRGE